MTKVLLNNVVVNSEHLAGAHSVAIGFWFGVGSRDENEGSFGVSHFVEHLLFEGTSGHTSRELSYSFDAMGGYANAYTDKENVCIYCHVPREHYMEALYLLCDMTSNSTFATKEVEKERSVIQSEILSSMDDDEDSALEAMAKRAWNYEGLSRPIAGSVESVAALSRELLYAWYEKHIKGGPLCVCIAGNIVEEECYKALQMLPMRKRAILRPEPLPSSAWRGGYAVEETKFSSMQVFLAIRIRDYALTSRLYDLGELYNAIMGDTTSSRLFWQLREHLGLCYNVYSSFSYYKDAGFWYAYANCEKKNIVPLLEALVAIVTKGECYSVEELSCAKGHVIGGEALCVDSTGYRIKRLYHDYHLGLSHEGYDELVQRVGSITVKDLEAFTKELLEGAKLLFITGAKLGAAESTKLQEIAKGLGL